MADNKRKQPEKNPSDSPQPIVDRKEDPTTAGPGEIRVRSNTPENLRGEINPSAPNDSITPGSNLPNQEEADVVIPQADGDSAAPTPKKEKGKKDKAA